MLAQEDATGLGAFGLDLGDCADEELGVALRQVAFLFEDEQELVFGKLVEVELDETVAEGARELLAAGVLARKVLCGEKNESRS